MTDTAASDEVAAAFALLADELAIALVDAKTEAEQALAQDRFADVRDALAAPEAVAAIRDRAQALAAEWRHVGLRSEPAGEAIEGHVAHGAVSKRDLGRVKPGTITPEPTFRRAVLEALVELGGSGEIQQVTDLVGERMEGRLNELDLAELPSGKGVIRWRNNVAWARNNLVNAGLMKPRRVTGVWEISDDGRQWLKDAEGRA